MSKRLYFIKKPRPKTCKRKMPYLHKIFKVALYITEISKVLTARLGIQNAQSHLINRFQNSLKSHGQKS